MTSQWVWPGLTHPLNHFQDGEKGKEDAPDWGQLPSSLFLASRQSPGSLLEGAPQGLEWAWLGPHLCISFPGLPGKLLRDRNANNLLV